MAAGDAIQSGAEVVGAGGKGGRAREGVAGRRGRRSRHGGAHCVAAHVDAAEHAAHAAPDGFGGCLHAWGQRRRHGKGFRVLIGRQRNGESAGAVTLLLLDRQLAGRTGVVLVADQEAVARGNLLELRDGVACVQARNCGERREACAGTGVGFTLEIGFAAGRSRGVVPAETQHEPKECQAQACGIHDGASPV